MLLHVSYRFHSDPQYPMKIVWNSGNMQDNLVTCSVLKCSLGARGVPGICSAQIFYHPTYRNRIKLFPENGTLLLSDLRPSDSGVYSVTFQVSHQTFHINLTVHEHRSTAKHPRECKCKVATLRLSLTSPTNGLGRQERSPGLRTSLASLSSLSDHQTYLSTLITIKRRPSGKLGQGWRVWGDGGFIFLYLVS